MIEQGGVSWIVYLPSFGFSCYLMQLTEPVNEIVLLEGSDAEMHGQVHRALANIEAGGYGKKVLLKFGGV